MIDIELLNILLPYIYSYVAVLSLITFFIFGIDKYKAINQKGKRVDRIPEKTLFLFSFLGGTFGAVLAMVLFRHKIKKGEFLIKFFIVSLVQFEIIYFIVKG